MEKQGYGYYETIPEECLPSLYIAYRAELSESSEVFHNDIRARFERGDNDVVDAMKFWASLAEEVRKRLLNGDGNTIGELLNANFDMRRKIYKISHGNIEMVEAARSVGASAKFSGSGGAIIGTYTDEEMFQKLSDVLAKINVKTIKPVIIKES
jgi:glucuronokinase